MKELILFLERKLKEKNQLLVAIEGRCASGKTTLAQALSLRFDGVVIHTDDFVLPHEKKTPERLAVPGGNFDSDRFLEEVMIPLKKGEEFSYSPYQCSTKTLGEPIFVPRKNLVLLEGSYSMHPDLGEVYDVCVFLDISPKEQRERLEKRCPEKLQMFLDLWIPLEEKYHNAFSIRERCHFVLPSNFIKEDR